MNDLKKLKQICKDLTILYVEDEIKIQNQAVAYFSKFFSLVDVAKDGQEGLEKYKSNHYDIVITDIYMPKLDGLDMSKQIKDIDKNQKIVIVSGCSDSENFLKSLKIGIDGYILKPFEFIQINEIIYKIANSIKESNENELYKNKLEELVYIKTIEARELEKEKIKNYKDALLTLVDLTEQRDTYTGGHSLRVAKYCKFIAQELDMKPKDIDDLYEAAILHDIGKIAIPDSILLKPGKLSKVEYSIIQLHVKLGYELLVKYPMFKNIANIIKVHHERIDGSGYPDGLKGDEINLCGKIMGVADSFDAMTTNRIYKAKKTPQEALKELKSLAGVRFDEKVVEASIVALKDIEVQQEITQDPFSEMEKERFSYFYKDQLTQVYNKNYLDLILNKNKFTNKYKELQILFLKNFSQYNKKYGWIGGDILLKEISALLEKIYQDALVFRIHGDDFVIIGKQGLILEDMYEFCENKLVKCSHLTVNIQENNINSLKDLENFIGN